MKTLSRLALTLGLAALGTTSVAAAEAAGPTGPGDEAAYGVRIVNNYGAAVRVFAEDASGHLHRLGRVPRGKLVEFPISPVVAAGHFSIKVFPTEPVWSLQEDDFGVKTNPINLVGGEDVTIWLEPDLKKSMVEMKRG